MSYLLKKCNLVVYSSPIYREKCFCSQKFPLREPLTAKCAQFYSNSLSYMGLTPLTGYSHAHLLGSVWEEWKSLSVSHTICITQLGSQGGGRG